MINLGNNHAAPGSMPTAQRRPMAVRSPDPGGRPTVMTPDVLQKLEAAFMNVFTDAQACDYAGIAPATLYNYQNENPAFLERKTMLRERPDMAAKLELVTGIKGSLEQARWWAAHKMGGEFAPKTKIEMKVESSGPSMSDAARAVATEYEEKLRQAIVEGGQKKP